MVSPRDQNRAQQKARTAFENNANKSVSPSHQTSTQNPIMALLERIIVHPPPRDTPLEDVPMPNVMLRTAIGISTIAREQLQDDAVEEHVPMDDIKELYGPRILDYIPKDMFFAKEFGHGAYGKIYALCNQHKSYQCNLVAKIQQFNAYQYGTQSYFKRAMQMEVDMQKRFQAKHLAPRIYSNHFFEHQQQLYHISIIERVNNTLDDVLTKIPNNVSIQPIVEYTIFVIDKLIRDMCSLGLTHGDFHTGNITIQLDPETDTDDQSIHFQPRIQMIDFGFASYGNCYARIEFLQIIRSFYISYNRFRNKKLADSLIASMYHHYKTIFPYDPTPNTMAAINHAHKHALRQYKTNIYNKQSRSGWIW